FEHMMFQGSANVGKGEHFQLIERAGGSMNGTTNEDRTNYFETLPSNRLNLGLWLEADRMRSLAITKENFENQRETVKEERRLGVDNRPYGAAFTDGLTLPFDSTGCFAYAHTVIGSMDDLNAAKLEDVQAFFNLYYAPNNATLVVVGDFESAEAKRLIAEYFGGLERGAEPPGVSCEVRYAPGSESRTFDDPLANLPAVLLLYRMPGHADPATRPLQLLSTILGQGESSRLHQGLVREAKSALQTGTFVDSRRGPSVFIAFAIANQGVSAGTLAAQLAAQVARLGAEEVTPDELTKARNDFRASDILGRQTTMQIAEQIQHYAHYHDALDELHTDLDRYMAVTADDIRAAARRYLVPQNSYAIIVLPKAAASTGGGP
ncbi:MAG: M16 family metallopeptidase, partial [Gemmatimonadales bacterium]